MQQPPSTRATGDVTSTQIGSKRELPAAENSGETSWYRLTDRAGGHPGWKNAAWSSARDPSQAAAAVTSAGWTDSADSRFISGSSAKEMIAPATATPPSQKYSRM